MTSSSRHPEAQALSSKLHTTGFAATNVQLLQNSMRLMGGRKGYQSDAFISRLDAVGLGATTAMS